MPTVEVISHVDLSGWLERMGALAYDAQLHLDAGLTEWFAVTGNQKGVSRRLHGALVGEGIVQYNHATVPGTLLWGGTPGAWRALLQRFPDEANWHSVAECIGGLMQLPVELRAPTRMGDTEWYWGERTYLMGILNVTPDSFSDGGQYLTTENALKRAARMLEEGADLIDVGGESTRPGSDAVSLEEELGRVLPVIKGIVCDLGGVVSIDTNKAAVAEAAIQAGASMINDITGLHGDERMAEVAAAMGVPVILMHIQGRPKDMQVRPTYTSVVPEVIEALQGSVDRALAAGIRPENIILDPGFGFGKNLAHNLALLRRLKDLRSLGYPILSGTSRKSMVGALLNLPVNEREEGTAATVAHSVAGLADIVRVHDVQVMYRALRVSDAIVRGISVYR